MQVPVSRHSILSLDFSYTFIYGFLLLYGFPPFSAVESENHRIPKQKLRNTASLMFFIGVSMIFADFGSGTFENMPVQ